MNLDDETVEGIRRNLRAMDVAPKLAEALRVYLRASPQCECTDDSGCEMADARAVARAALDEWDAQ